MARRPPGTRARLRRSMGARSRRSVDQQRRVADVPAVRCDDLEHLVLKIRFPDREGLHEDEALRRWDGDGAVRLIDHDPERRALLLERCEPGAPLSSEDPDEALGVLIGLLPRVWVPAGPPFRPLADEAADLTAELIEHWERTGRTVDAADPGSGGSLRAPRVDAGGAGAREPGPARRQRARRRAGALAASSVLPRSFAAASWDTAAIWSCTGSTA